MEGIDIPVILIAGYHIAVGVLLTVQGLKVFGFVDGDNAARAAVVSGFAFGGLSLVSQLVPDAEPYVNAIFSVYLGSLGAGLFYEYIAAPVLERFGVAISSKDLS